MGTVRFDPEIVNVELLEVPLVSRMSEPAGNVCLAGSDTLTCHLTGPQGTTHLDQLN